MPATYIFLFLVDARKENNDETRDREADQEVLTGGGRHVRRISVPEYKTNNKPKHQNSYLRDYFHIIVAVSIK